jgi:type IX secretion system PorP/SprF family membrane protein
MKLNKLFVFISIIIAFNSKAQVVMFNQYLANAIYENPAYVGAFERPTFSTYYGQHISTFSDYPNYNMVGENFGFSYQQYSNLLKGGIGISFSGVHYYADGNYSVINDGLKLSYSPSIKIFKKIYLKPGIDIGLYHEKDKYPSITETYNPYAYLEDGVGIDNYFNSGADNHSNNYLDVNAGLLLYGKNFHVAVCVNHLNNPSTYALNNYVAPDVYYTNTFPYPTTPQLNTKQPQRDFITVDLGMNINSKDSAKTWTFSPHLFLQDNGYSYFNYGGNYNENRYEPNTNILLGFTYRNKGVLCGLDYTFYDGAPDDGLAFMVGYQAKMFRISYSYTVYLTGQNPGSSGPANTPGLNSILLTYSLPVKSKSTPPLFTTIY